MARMGGGTKHQATVQSSYEFKMHQLQVQIGLGLTNVSLGLGSNSGPHHHLFGANIVAWSADFTLEKHLSLVMAMCMGNNECNY